ncbi:MAG: putative toxin-antitoxin system toxin component, PIN family [Desulfobia sp.]
MSSRIYVVDTNVLAAGLITLNPGSPTTRILDAMLNGTIFFLVSTELLQEYRSVLLRPGLTRLHGLTRQEIDQILTEITANAVWRDPQPDKANPSPDPQDAHLWALLASDPKAVLITGDKLLIDNPGPQSSVITPAAWVEYSQH